MTWHVADIRIAERIANVRVVSYAYKEPIARTWGLNEDDRHRIGVIAQELAEVIPDAVKQNGEFLTVDDTRIFYDVVASAQQLHQMTQNLEVSLATLSVLCACDRQKFLTIEGQT